LDDDVAIQHEAVAACRQAGDRLGEARARNALGLLCLRRGYHSSARIEFESSLRLLADLGDGCWMPVVRMHVAECMAGVALYREAREVLAESLAVFRERGDTSGEAEALHLLRAIQDAVERHPSAASGASEASCLPRHGTADVRLRPLRTRVGLWLRKARGTLQKLSGSGLRSTWRMRG